MQCTPNGHELIDDELKSIDAEQTVQIITLSHCLVMNCSLFICYYSCRVGGNFKVCQEWEESPANCQYVCCYQDSLSHPVSHVTVLAISGVMIYSSSVLVRSCRSAIIAYLYLALAVV